MSLVIDSDSTALTPSPLTGTVTAVQANFYQVYLDSEWVKQLAVPAMLLCTRRTRLKKIGQKVMVGDRVEIEDPDWNGGRGAIAEVFPRQTELNRPPIANANQILLVFSVAEPDLDPLALSRFLIKAESTQLDVKLCLNKCDLIDIERLQAWFKRLQNWGYQPLLISVCQKLEYSVEPGITSQPLIQGNPNSDLLQQLRGKITVISGPSGVGKSSLINQLIPQIDLRVGKVSGKLGRGRHTTRHVELFELPTGGLLADSPGFNQPQLDCVPQQLSQYFPEIQQRLALGSCQFNDCLHRDEPNCVVRGDWERYNYYLEFLQEAVARQDAILQQPDAESSLKSKTTSGGKRQYEPKLESKKYRRTSRRVQHQTLQDLCEEIDEI
jgi:ribosome biogenesis GTPase